MAPGDSEATQISMAMVVAWPSDTLMAIGLVHTLGTYVIFVGNKDHGHQYRPWL